MNEPEKITVLIADDHTIVREGLARILNEATNIQVVGEAVDGREAVDKALEVEPDIVLLDLSMPRLHGLEALRQIRRRSPKTKCLVLSMHKNEAYVRQALQGGASGYILKDSAAEDVVSAIRAVHTGECFLSPGVSKLVIEDYLRGSGPDRAISAYENLTEREREVFQLLVEGLRNQEIARRLHVSVKTIETHRAHILTKLGLSNIAELVKYAIEMGILNVDT
jgi:two-component system response regulator NreC